ncbi:MAG: hypothetical protein ABIN99_07890 [Nitrosospira sp.]
MANGITFLSLAYLVEVSIVLNLTYRELKIAKLHKKLLRTRDLLKDKTYLEIPDEAVPELKRFESLLRSSNGDGDLWRNVKFRKYFFFHFIRSGQSLSIVNCSILANVACIIIFTLFSEKPIQPGIFDPLHLWQHAINPEAKLNEVFTAIPGLFEIIVGFVIVISAVALKIRNWTISNNIWEYILLIGTCILFGIINVLLFSAISHFNAFNVWHIALGCLLAMTILPLLFIRMATLCEGFLYGDEHGSGIVATLAEIFARKERELADIRNLAREFEVNPPQ